MATYRSIRLPVAVAHPVTVALPSPATKTTEAFDSMWSGSVFGAVTALRRFARTLAVVNVKAKS
jgi:hypothetical protein